PDVTATSEYISPRVETMFGYPPEAWKDSEFFPSVLHPDDRERVLVEQEKWLSGNVDRWTNEYRVLAADGRTVWVRDDAWIVQDDAREEGRDVTREALEDSRAHRIGRRKRKDGANVEVELMLVPLRVDGEHVGYYAIYHDITELQRARQEAEAATLAKSAFLAT